MFKTILYSDKTINIGLLILRIGIGIAFILHGYPKLMGGAENLAINLTKHGIPGGVISAYLAAIAEVFGGIAIVLGLFTRPASFFFIFHHDRRRYIPHDTGARIQAILPRP